MEKNYFVPIGEHPEMFIGELTGNSGSDNGANTQYSQDTEAWD